MTDDLATDRSRLATMLAVLAGLFVCLYFLRDVAEFCLDVKRFNDFANYYLFSKLLAAGHDIYGFDARDPLLQPLKSQHGLDGVYVGVALYAPLCFFLMRSFTWMPFAPAAVLWAAMNVVLLVVSALVLLKGLKSRPSLLDFAAVGFLIFCFQPAKESFATGQANVLILFFVTLSLVSLIKRRDVLAGVCLSPILLMKLQFGLLAPYFLLKKRYKTFVAVMIAFAVMKAVSIATLGVEVQSAYVRGLAAHSNVSRSAISPASLNLSLSAALNRLVNIDAYPSRHMATRAVWLALSLGTMGCVAWFARGRAAGPHVLACEVGAVLAVALIVCPETREDQLVMLYIPLIALWIGALPTAGLGTRVVFCFAFLTMALPYNLMRFPFFHYGLPSLCLDFKLLGVVLVLVLSCATARTRCPSPK